MKHSRLATFAALGLAASSSTFAQEQPAGPATPSSQAQQQVDVGDEEIRKFAEIYVGIEQTRAEISRELSEAEDDQEAQEIQVRAQDRIVDMIEEQGWSVAQFNQVANAINNDPELRQQAVDQIKQMGTG